MAALCRFFGGAFAALQYARFAIEHPADLWASLRGPFVDKLPHAAEQGEKVEAGEREKIESALKALKDSLAGADIEAVKQAHEALVGASQEFAQRLYAATSAQGGPAGGQQAPSDDEVADAEIVDEDPS